MTAAARTIEKTIKTKRKGNTNQDQGLEMTDNLTLKEVAESREEVVIIREPFKNLFDACGII